MDARILVLSASVGAGHVRAAEAVTAAIEQAYPQAQVKHLEVLRVTNPAFRKLYGQAYLELVNKAPHMLGFFYDVMDHPRRPRSIREKLRRLVGRLNLGKLCQMLECDQWDVIVNTHFLPAEIIASLRRQGKIRTPQITVTTDFDTHRLWVNPPTDHYCTATEEGKDYLAHWGVALEAISVTGIPIHPNFANPQPRQEVLERHGLSGDRPIVLQLSGGFGVGPIEHLYQAVLSVNTPVQVVVVTGKNRKAQESLQQIAVPPRHRAKVIGFTEQMHELMSVADVVVSKPGGLTTSEALASGAAMCIVNPIPGQETRNSDFLLENGAAIKINNVATLGSKLDRLLDDAAMLKRLKDNARRLGRPRAAFDVAALAMRYAQQPQSQRGRP